MNIYIPVAGSVRLAKRERDATRPSQSSGMTMFAFNFIPRTLDARIAQWDLYFNRRDLHELNAQPRLRVLESVWAPTHPQVMQAL